MGYTSQMIQNLRKLRDDLEKAKKTHDDFMPVTTGATSVHADTVDEVVLSHKKKADLATNVARLEDEENELESQLIDLFLNVGITEAKFRPAPDHSITTAVLLERGLTDKKRGKEFSETPPEANTIKYRIAIQG